MKIYLYSFADHCTKCYCCLQERVKSVFHAKEFGKIINFKTPEIAKVGSILKTGILMYFMFY